VRGVAGVSKDLGHQMSRQTVLRIIGTIVAGGTTVAFEHIGRMGNRAEMLRIRNEPARGVYIDALYYYMVDYDLDGLIDVGSTTKIEASDRQERAPIAHVIEFFSRSTKHGDQFQANFQKMYDEGIQIALKYFGE
jgi:hypothetical protein